MFAVRGLQPLSHSTLDAVGDISVSWVIDLVELPYAVFTRTPQADHHRIADGINRVTTFRNTFRIDFFKCAAMDRSKRCSSNNRSLFSLKAIKAGSATDEN